MINLRHASLAAITVALTLSGAAVWHWCRAPAWHPRQLPLSCGITNTGYFDDNRPATPWALMLNPPHKSTAS